MVLVVCVCVKGIHALKGIHCGERNTQSGRNTFGNTHYKNNTQHRDGICGGFLSYPPMRFSMVLTMVNMDSW